MNIKKLFILQLLMVNSLTCTYDFNDENLKKLATSGAVISAIACVGYIWATSGDSVEQRIEDAQNELDTMSEYEQEFDITPLTGEKESQILSVLEHLHIDINTISKSYDEKLHTDYATLQKVYNNLWFKSFYGGQEIAEITRKVEQYKTKVQGILSYLEQHKKFIEGNQIINELAQLSQKSLHNNKNEIVKLAKSHDSKSSFPLVMYVKKIQKDLECIEFLMTEKNAQKDYPTLSLIISNYQEKLEEIKHIVSIMEEYKQEALAKLENDITELTTKYEKLERLVKQLQFDVAMARMR